MDYKLGYVASMHDNIRVSVVHQAVAGVEAGQLSDATMSGPASDDEAGSLAAVDGSNMQVSSVENSGNGAGSDSGGSQVESVSGKPLDSSLGVANVLKLMQTNFCKPSVLPSCKIV